MLLFLFSAPLTCSSQLNWVQTSGAVQRFRSCWSVGGPYPGTRYVLVKPFSPGVWVVHVQQLSVKQAAMVLVYAEAAGHPL